jgi:hypothetical protein
MRTIRDYSRLWSIASDKDPVEFREVIEHNKGFIRKIRDSLETLRSRIVRVIMHRPSYHPLTTMLWALSLFTGDAMAEKLQFARDIRPILSDSCFKCHGPDAEARQADLRLDQSAVVLEAGVLDSGEMLKRLTSDDPDVRMPPPDANRPLRPEQRAALVRWLESGAPWPENDRHWSLVPPQEPALPLVTDKAWPRSGIDHFVLARLERVGLKPTPEAEKVALLRRASFDLTGLPPTLQALDALLDDESPDAYEKAVDRLLASPRYGEHMALGWLEAARYADTDGFQGDRVRHMWVWRDWVIRAFNDNMPFDQFVVEQMAGDLLPDRHFFTQVATGFNRNHRITSEGGSIPDEWLVEYVADRVETMSTVFLGLTLGCARCHDHKFDPISQKDFYRLFAFFNNVAEAGLGANTGNSPPFIPVPTSWPNLSETESQFVEPEPLKITVTQTAVPRPQKGGADTVMVMHDLAVPRDTFLLNRGQYDRPNKSETLRPSIPPALGGWRDEWPRNRLGLARWLMDPAHPLTARVTVNRIWQQLFGIGLVKTSEDFGAQGEFPSHPQLLDWLATQLVRTGWDTKEFYKRIVTTATYRQASRASLDLQRQDPENRLMAHGPRKRLTPFAIRDAALANSGLLVEKIGGPSVKPYMPLGLWKATTEYVYEQDHGEALYRRSVYTYWRRTVPPPTMMAFNASPREICIVRQGITTTPLQALTLMNNIAFVEAARFLAERMLTEGGAEPQQRVAFAFRLVTSRRPTPQEMVVLLQTLKSFQSDFANDPSAAAQLLTVGERSADPTLPPAELAAYALVANTILNLDEAIMEN